jgi:hypothetical protein
MRHTAPPRQQVRSLSMKAPLRNSGLSPSRRPPPHTLPALCPVTGIKPHRTHEMEQRPVRSGNPETGIVNRNGRSFARLCPIGWTRIHAGTGRGALWMASAACIFKSPSIPETSDLQNPEFLDFSGSCWYIPRLIRTSAPEKSSQRSFPAQTGSDSTGQTPG